MDLTQGSTVFQYQPGLIGMIVDLDEILNAYHQQAVAFEMLHKIVVNGIFIQTGAFNEQLGIKLVFDPGKTSVLENVECFQYSITGHGNPFPRHKKQTAPGNREPSGYGDLTE